MTSEWLAHKYLEDWRADNEWDLQAFIQKIERDTGVDVGYYKAYYAKKMALKMIHGSAVEKYGLVHDYAAALMQYLRGSTATVGVLRVDRAPPMFQRFYMCLQPCKEDFIQGCRHILGVDGCHLKGVWSGVCLTAVGKDGNNNLFPVAWAVVEVENKDTWSWFLNLLKKDLSSIQESVVWVHENDEMVYMSDRHKGLLQAFKDVVPNAETRYCCRHIWANFKLKWPGQLFKSSFWAAARATKKHEFEGHLNAIKFLNVEAYNWLKKIPPKHWSRHEFNTKTKSAMLLNNVCESFNNVLRKVRNKPILTMMEWLRRYVMKRVFTKREALYTYEGLVMPSIVKQIEKDTLETRVCYETPASANEWEVEHEGNRWVVKVLERSCGCNKWDLTGIPCCHAIKVIQRLRGNPIDYVHKAYTKKAYESAYNPTFHAIPGPKQWEKTGNIPPLPLTFKEQPGRPKAHKRIKEKGEGQAEDVPAILKKRKLYVCSKCGTPGHNKGSCKTNDPTPRQQLPPKPRGRPKKSGPDVVTKKTGNKGPDVPSRKKGKQKNKGSPFEA